jgi:hypothetical protein
MKRRIDSTKEHKEEEEKRQTNGNDEPPNIKITNEQNFFFSQHD